jgi:hypothetical protein
VPGKGGTVRWDRRRQVFAFSSAFPPDRGIDVAIVLLILVCIVAIVYALDWAQN